jgi:hypothetical protein
VIWEPFVLALFLGLIVSAGLYFAYLWPSVEPDVEPAVVAAHSEVEPEPASAVDEPPAEEPPAEAPADDEASPPS